MQCLRCNAKMKHYPLNTPIQVYGAEHKPHTFAAITRIPHNIHSVYICEQCGCAELNTEYCDNPDI